MIIFSLSGVLVETLQTSRALYRDALVHFGLSLKDARFEELYSSRDMCLLDRALVAAARKADDLEFIIGFNRRRDQILKDTVRVHRYATRAFEWLSEAKAVVDWLPLKQVEVLLDASGLAGRFKLQRIISYSGENFEGGLIRAARSLDRPPASTIVVESSAVAIARAAALGFKVIGIALLTTPNYDNHLNAFSRAGATLTVPDFRYVPLAVKQLSP